MDGLIYAYHAPNSTAQRAYTEQRIAQIAAERNARKNSQSHLEHGEYGERRDSSSWIPLRTLQYDSESRPSHPTRGSSSTISQYPGHRQQISRITTGQLPRDLIENPFELSHGRRYLKNVPYPLPVDLVEIQRQNLRTLLSTTVFGKPICATRWERETPRRILELGCGGGFWSATAQDYFRERGDTKVEFVGLDIAPLAPDFQTQGVNWRFVQHDCRQTPLPFDDGEFDAVMIKDMGLCLPFGGKSAQILQDCIRVLSVGGTVEIWDSDYIIQSMPPDLPPSLLGTQQEQMIAKATATFAIPPEHSFLPAQNEDIQNANTWIAEALERRDLCPTPCVKAGEMLGWEGNLSKIAQRRVAIPFGELRFERKAFHQNQVSHRQDSPMSVGSRGGAKDWESCLTPNQAALRHTALMTVLQQIESMEPMLREVSGKNTAEWNQWRASMMSELLDPSNSTALAGECLVIGAWWATKTADGKC